MDMYVFMGIVDDLRAKGKDLSKYTLTDIKRLYGIYVR